MNYHDLRRYLGLDEAEFGMLLISARPEQVEAWADMAQVSDNLEQLPGRYNRPPETEDDDPVHRRLDALSEAAFARLDALIAEHEEFRRARAEAPSGRRRGGKRRAFTPAQDRQFKREMREYNEGQAWAVERGFEPDPEIRELAMERSAVNFWSETDPDIACDAARRLAAKVKNLGQKA